MLARHRGRAVRRAWRRRRWPARAAGPPAPADGAATTRSTRTATCWSSAPGRPGSPPPLAAAAGGARVILVDERAEPGGEPAGRRPPRRSSTALAPLDWVADVAAALTALPRGPGARRTTVARPYDARAIAVERRSGAPSRAQRLWHIRAGRVVLATGAHERPLAFADNDRPGRHARRRRPRLRRPLRRRARPARRRLHHQRQRLRRRRRPGRRGRRGRGDRRRAAERCGRPPPRCARIDVVDGHAVVGRRRAGASTGARRADRRRRPGSARDRARPAAGLGRLEPGGCTCSARPAAACATTTRSRAFVPGDGRRRVRCAGAAAGRRPGGRARRRRGRAAARQPRPSAGGAAGAAPPVTDAGAVDGAAARAVARPVAGRPPGDATSSTCSATSPSPTCGARSAPGCARSSTSSATPRRAPAHDQGKTSGVLAVGVRGRSCSASAWRELGTDHVPAAVRPGLASRCSPAATAARCTTRCGSRRCTPGTWRTARSSRTSASGSARGTTRGDGEDLDAAVLRECRAAREGVGDDGRLHARQDRRPGPGRGGVPRPALHQRLRQARASDRAATA